MRAWGEAMPRKYHIDHAPIVKAFAARLREKRVAAGMTQLELAQRAGLAANYISRLEAARIAPGLDTVQQLADALGVTAHDLIPLSDPADEFLLTRERLR